MVPCCSIAYYILQKSYKWLNGTRDDEYYKMWLYFAWRRERHFSQWSLVSPNYPPNLCYDIEKTGGHQRWLKVQKARPDGKISHSWAKAVANKGSLIRKKKIIKNEISQQPIKMRQLVTSHHSLKSHLWERSLTTHTAIITSPQKGT